MSLQSSVLSFGRFESEFLRRKSEACVSFGFDECMRMHRLSDILYMCCCYGFNIRIRALFTLIWWQVLRRNCLLKSNTAPRFSAGFKPARCRIGKRNRRITFGFFLLMWRSLEALGDVVVLMSAAFYQPSVVNCRKILLTVLPTSFIIRALCRRDKLIASFISKNRQACFEARILDCLAVCCCKKPSAIIRLMRLSLSKSNLGPEKISAALFLVNML